MEKKIKVGIIGCGGIANGKHMPSLKKTGEVEMVAFCDIIEERAVEAVFFGHTHQPIDDIYDLENGDRIRLFNPGSIGYDGIYGVVNIKAGAIVTSHGKI